MRPVVCLYMCCRGVKYHEPEYWKFGDEGNKYFRHATGQIYAISKDLAAYISINQLLFPDGHICILYLALCHVWPRSSVPNDVRTCMVSRPILHRFANEDVSLGAWLIGLEVEHVDDRSMCCATPPGTAPPPLSA